MIPSVRDLAAAAWALLADHDHLPAYQSQATAPVLGKGGSLESGYAVFHPGGGNDQPDNLAMSPNRLLWGFQVSCVGSDHDQLGWVIDVVRGLFTGRTLTVDDIRVGRMQPPPGFQAPPPRPDDALQPTRLLVPLQYQVLAVSSPPASTPIQTP